MRLIIRRCYNGFYLEKRPDKPCDDDPIDRYVFSGDTDEDMVRAMADMAMAIDDLIGVSTCKYSKARFYARVEPGEDSGVVTDTDVVAQKAEELLTKLRANPDNPHKDECYALIKALEKLGYYL